MKNARWIPVLIAVAVLAAPPPACGQEATPDAEAPQGVRMLHNKPFDDGEAARQELLDLYDGLRVTDVVDGLDLIGLQDVTIMDQAIRPLWRDAEDFSHRFAGFALTVRYVPSDVRVGQGSFDSLEGYQRFKQQQYARASDRWWIETARPGDVLVMDVHGVEETGNVGSNNSLNWARNGIVGVVTNGGARDTDEIVKVQRPPVYAHHGYSTRGVRPGRLLIESFNFPVSVGGVLVYPGDVVVGDGDGVVVVPREHALTVGRLARAIHDGDQQGRRRHYEALGVPEDETVRVGEGATRSRQAVELADVPVDVRETIDQERGEAAVERVEEHRSEAGLAYHVRAAYDDGRAVDLRVLEDGRLLFKMVEESPGSIRVTTPPLNP